MEEKSKGGRPPKLEPDEKTLGVVKGLGQIQATSKECAAVLGVSEPTWIKFKRDHLEVQEALEIGQGQGLASLRRRQFKKAEEGNPTMLIWLGKQHLGQADKQEHTGKGGGPLEFVDLSKLSGDELALLESIFGRMAGPDDDAGADPAGEGPTRH